MIIDTHTHIGLHGKTEMKLEYLLDSMMKYGVDFSLVSSTYGEEFYNDNEVIPYKDQYSINEDLIDIVKNNSSMLGALLWMKPYHESVNEKLIQLVKSNRDYIYGLKFHPFHSNLAFNDPKMKPYFELAKEFGLPIVTHTAASYESSVELVGEIAKEYESINFVLVHMGLGTDNKKAIELISEIENLYGDTTWVPYQNVIEAIRLCGKTKILFGTDNTIDGVDTLGSNFYQPFFNELKQYLSEEEYEHLMHKNAERLFGIRL